MRLPTGHIRKRGNVWWCQWKHHGVPYAQSLKTRDANAAAAEFERAMVLVRASMVNGTFFTKYGRDGVSTIEDGDIRLAHAWRHYRGSTSRPDASPQTVQQYEYQWERLLEWLRVRHPNVRRVSQVTRHVAQEFAAHLLGQVSITTYNRYVQLFRLVYRVLCDDLGLGIDANPWRGIQKKKANGNGHTGRRPFTDEELRRIFLTLQKRSEGRQIVWAENGIAVERKLGEHDRVSAGELLTLCLLGFHTGLRLGDCCLLGWGSVDLAKGKGVISLTPLKTARTSGKKVAIPIHPELSERLSAIRPENAAGPVCPGKAEQYQRNRAEVTKRFRRLFLQCGIRTQGEKGNGTAVGIAVCEVGFHSFRHTWVTRSAEDGVDSITIREVVGWGSPAMERVYTHVSQEHVRSQMDKRTSKAFPSPEEHPAIPAAVGVADVGSMDTDGIKELACRLAAELAKRGAGKC